MTFIARGTSVQNAVCHDTSAEAAEIPELVSDRVQGSSLEGGQESGDLLTRTRSRRFHLRFLFHSSVTDKPWDPNLAAMFDNDGVTLRWLSLLLAEAENYTEFR